MASLLKRIATYGYKVVASNSPYPNDAGDLMDKSHDITFLFENSKQNASTTIFMGYSLGSLAAIKAGEQHVPGLVLAIAPPTHEFSFQEISLSQRYGTFKSNYWRERQCCSS